MNEKFPAGYTQRMEDLSKEADAAFAVPALPPSHSRKCVNILQYKVS